MAKRPKKDARKDHRRTQIKKGDLVKVISGTYTGTQGKVIEILKSRGRVRVEGVAPLKRHIGHVCDRFRRTSAKQVRQNWWPHMSSATWPPDEVPRGSTQMMHC